MVTHAIAFLLSEVDRGDDFLTPRPLFYSLLEISSSMAMTPKITPIETSVTVIMKRIPHSKLNQPMSDSPPAIKQMIANQEFLLRTIQTFSPPLSFQILKRFLLIFSSFLYLRRNHFSWQVRCYWKQRILPLQYYS